MARSARDELLESLDRILKGLAPIIKGTLAVDKTFCGEKTDENAELTLPKVEQRLLDREMIPFSWTTFGSC